MKHLKKFKLFCESVFYPSMDDDVIDDILDRKEFTDSDKKYLDNFSKNNKIVVELLDKLTEAINNLKITENKMRFWIDIEKPTLLLNQWVNHNREMIKLESELLNYRIKVSDIENLQKDLSLEVEEPDIKLSEEEYIKLQKEWEDLVEQGLNKDDICQMMYERYKKENF